MVNTSLFASSASLNAAEPLEVVLEVALHLLVLDGGQGGVGPEFGVQTPPGRLDLLRGGDTAPAPPDPPGLLGGRGVASEGGQNRFITSGGQGRGSPDQAEGLTLLRGSPNPPLKRKQIFNLSSK